MPVKFKDISKSANDLLGKGFNANSELTVKAKASNGVTYTTKIQSKGEGNVAGNVNAAFNHSSGFNVKKLEISNNGQLASDIDLTGVVDNTTFSLGVVILPLDLLADDGREKVEVGVQYQHEKANVNVTVSPVAPTSAAVALSVAAIDNVVIGGSYKGQLDDTWQHTDAAVGARYSAGNSTVALVASKMLQSFTLTGHHQQNADLAFAAAVKVARSNPRQASISVGADYKLDADTTVKGKVDVPNGSTDGASASLSFKQKINSSVRLTASSNLNLDPNGDDLFGANLALGLELGAL